MSDSDNVSGAISTPAPSTKRWGLLRSVLLKKPAVAPLTNDGTTWSVRRHSSFGLFACSQREDVEHADLMVQETVLSPTHSVVLRLRKPDSVTFDDLKAAQDSRIDNTGNIQQWPSEEVLAFWCLQNAPNFRCVDLS
jgi:calmodulin-lysine N-methyltransferase